MEYDFFDQSFGVRAMDNGGEPSLPKCKELGPESYDPRLGI